MGGLCDGDHLETVPVGDPVDMWTRQLELQLELEIQMKKTSACQRYLRILGLTPSKKVLQGSRSERWGTPGCRGLNHVERKAVKEEENQARVWGYRARGRGATVSAAAMKLRIWQTEGCSQSLTALRRTSSEK